MIRFLLFELEKTLVDGLGKVFAHVIEALKTMESFRTDTAESLSMCLISVEPAGPSGIDDTSDRLISRLETLGLKRFFDPVGRRVTLMMRADIQRFDQHLFDTTIARSMCDATPDQCVFFTGDHEVAWTTRGLNIKTLEFNPIQEGGTDFVNWLEAPLLVAKMLSGNRQKNTEEALRAYLAATENMDLVSLTASADPDTFLGKVSAWHAITSEKLRDLSGVSVRLPTEVRVQLDTSGKVKRVDRTNPSAEHEEEAKHFVESLVIHGQIAPESEVSPHGATHQISTDSEGRRYLIRKRFTAV